MNFFKKLLAREDLPPEEKERMIKEKEEKQKQREAEQLARQQKKQARKEAEKQLMEKYFGTNSGLINKMNFSIYKSAILYFEQHIKYPDEEVLISIPAEYDKTKKREIKGMLIATSDRLVFVTNGIGHGQFVEIFEYQKMNGIALAPDGFSQKELLIDYGRTRKIFDDIDNNHQFKIFLNTVMDKMNEAKRNPATRKTTKKEDKYDLLAKIAKLHEQGILADEEFQKEKEKILNS